MSRKIEEVEFLLKFYDERSNEQLVTLLTACTFGKFFSFESNCYFGQFPLLFAVCTDNIQIFDLVYEYAKNNDPNISDEKLEKLRETEPLNPEVVLYYSKIWLGKNVIFMRDTLGNNALHLCVLHSLQNMYEHIIKEAKIVLKEQINRQYQIEVCYLNYNKLNFLLFLRLEQLSFQYSLTK